MMSFKHFLILIIAAFALISCNKPKVKLLQINGSTWYEIKKFVDGDTFYVDDGSKKGVKIRLIGVDTPETKHPKKGVEYYGIEASAYIKKLLSENKVRIEFDVDTFDRYNRILAYVYTSDSIFINAELVKNGYARIATYPPNVKYVELFQELESIARTNNLRLWNEDVN
jgi:micrococcal nuclease